MPTPANFNALLGKTLGASVIPVSKTFLPIVIVMFASFGTCVPVPILNAVPS